MVRRRPSPATVALLLATGPLLAARAGGEDLFTPDWRGDPDSTYCRFDCDDAQPDEWWEYGEAAWGGWPQLMPFGYATFESGQVTLWDGPLGVFASFPSTYEEGIGYSFPETEAIIQVTTVVDFVLVTLNGWEPVAVDFVNLGDGRYVWAFEFAFDAFVEADPMGMLFEVMPVSDSATLDQIIVDIRAVPSPDCPADVTGDAVVDVLDLLAVLAAWGQTGGPEDVNGDGIVDVLDLLEVLGAWGPCQRTPEPDRRPPRLNQTTRRSASCGPSLQHGAGGGSGRPLARSNRTSHHRSV